MIEAVYPLQLSRIEPSCCQRIERTSTLAIWSSSEF
jgi:hypothetical protein